MSHFSLALKSTLDKILLDIATANGYEFFDLDGSYLTPEKTESEKPAIAWSLLSLSEAPRDPFWNLQFEAGAKTSNDEAQYVSLEIVSIVQELFTVGSSFPIADYSGTNIPTQNLGEIIISHSGSTPAAFDRASGLRSIHVMATVQRF